MLKPLDNKGPEQSRCLCWSCLLESSDFDNASSPCCPLIVYDRMDIPGQVATDNAPSLLDVLSNRPLYSDLKRH